MQIFSTRRVSTFSDSQDSASVQENEYYPVTRNCLMMFHNRRTTERILKAS